MNKNYIVLLILTTIVTHACNNQESKTYKTANPPKQQALVLDTVKTSINKVQTSCINIPENNFNVLLLKFRNQKKNVSEYNHWLTAIVAKVNDGDTSYFTRKCLDYVSDVIDYTWAYDGSIDKKTLYKKWEQEYDLRYAQFGHLFSRGNGDWEPKKLTKVEYIGELNNADWFRLTIKGGEDERDPSNTLVRVIKVLKIGNAYYIDNFISLSQE